MKLRLSEEARCLDSRDLAKLKATHTGTVKIRTGETLKRDLKKIKLGIAEYWCDIYTGTLYDTRRKVALTGDGQLPRITRKPAPKLDRVQCRETGKDLSIMPPGW